jgi:hypothetical protein
MQSLARVLHHHRKFMPLVFITIGTILIFTGIKGNANDLYTLIVNDVKGQNGDKGYAYWIVAIVILGLLGYIKNFEPLSRAFMILVLVVLVLNNKGFLKALQDQFSTLIKSTPSTSGS